MQHLDQKGLADRWQFSPRTLEQWRWQGKGPLYLKIGGRIVYRLSDIEAFEAASLHNNTVGPIDIAGDKESSDGTPETIGKALDGRRAGGGRTACSPARDGRTPGGTLAPSIRRPVAKLQKVGRRD